MKENKYLSEAFEALNILNEDTFDITADGITELKDFVSNDEVVEPIIDPLAQTEEELKDSYLGKAILDCVICQSKIYKDPEDVVISEEGDLANVGEICPYCQSSDGYKIIGQVAEYCPHCDEPEVKADAEVDVTVENSDEEAVTEDLEREFTVVGKSDNGETFIARVKAIDEAEAEKKFLDKKKAYTVVDVKATTDKDLEDGIGLLEDLNKVEIETDTQKIEIEAEPKEECPECEASKAEVIAPVTDETEAEFKVEEPEYQDVDIDEFEEEDFDELGEKYLRRVYENVKSYKTTKGAMKGNKIELEGVITFKSGKQGKTNFVFEAKNITKSGKLKFIGENKQFARGHQSFILTGKADGKKLIAEGLTYNYRTRDAKTGASKKLYGTVRTVK